MGLMVSRLVKNLKGNNNFLKLISEEGFLIPLFFYICCMEKVRIYLDDVRTPVDKNWLVVRNFHEFVNLVNKVGLTNISLISLDHDLGDSAMQEYFNNVSKNYKLDYDYLLSQMIQIDNKLS